MKEFELKAMCLAMQEAASFLWDTIGAATALTFAIESGIVD